MSIDVNPSRFSDSVSVATTVSNDVHYPEYIMCGVNDAGDISQIPVDENGHLEVAIHSPLLPFGSLHTEKLTPVFQSDAVYGINSDQVVTTTGIQVPGVSSATVTDTSNLFTCSTGATAYSFSTLQSRKRLRYRPGQGVVARFTALFTSPVASSILVAGIGTAEAGLYFGYNGTSYGILYANNGKREIQRLTITTRSTTAENVTVTLGGTAFTVAVTNAATTALTAYELSKGTYTGWKAEQIGSTVVFVADSAGNKSGTVSVSGTTIVGTGDILLEGQATTDTWIPQSSWNGDKMDGSGPSGKTIDTSKGNVYQIAVQYLGYGPLKFQIEVGRAGNNPIFSTVHTINYENENTAVSLTQPSFPFTMAAYSAGSTTNTSVSAASFMGAIEGEVILNGPRLSYSGTASSTTSQYTPVGSIRNDYVFKSRPNQSIINILDVNCAAKSTNGLTTLYLIKNGTLGGTPSFSQYSTTSAAYVDTAATSVTWSDNNQLVWSGTISESGQIGHSFPDEIKLQPGEVLTFAVRSVTNTATVVVSMNTREDH